ncbi:MAG: HAMP domain-containing protein [Candidatus Rokubacteria bacterium]|nr:HAMP domain-containing protein [Candidatus Rokubacteria bacterium]
MRDLTTRLVILLMLALMTITGGYDYVRLVRERERLVEQTQEDVRIFAETLALAVRRNVRRGRTTDELQELLDEILARPGLIRVAIYDPRGQVVATSVAEGTPAPQPDEAIQSALQTKEAASSVLEEGGSQLLRYIQPFRWPDGRTAVLEVRQSLAGVEREFGRAIRERLLSRVVLLVFFVLSIVALTRWSIARPIRALIQGARAVGRGNLAQRIHLGRRDEIGQLAEEFNRMAENLETAHQELLHEAEERLRLEGEVQQAQKLAAVGMLAAEVAHEVGTPLNVISGRAEALQRLIPQDDPGRRHLDVILKQTERITGIFRALLDYTRPRRPVLRAEGLLPLLARVVDLLASRCRAKGVRIQLDLPVILPAVLGDADQLQQVLLNVLLNALDASPPEGIVRVTEGPEPVLPTEGRVGLIRGKAEAPCLAIHIVDHGSGMTGDQLAHVFEPFFSTKGRGQGTGLGLPIVEEIVRAHRGEVEMLSIPGRGSEVIVRLPLAEGSLAARSTEPDTPEPEEHGR